MLRVTVLCMCQISLHHCYTDTTTSVQHIPQYERFTGKCHVVLGVRAAIYETTVDIREPGADELAGSTVDTGNRTRGSTHPILVKKLKS